MPLCSTGSLGVQYCRNALALGGPIADAKYRLGRMPHCRNVLAVHFGVQDAATCCAPPSRHSREMPCAARDGISTAVKYWL